MTPVLETVNKNIKTVDIAVFHVFKKLEEILTLLRKDVKDTTKSQIEIPEMKIEMPGMKNILDRIY